MARKLKVYAAEIDGLHDWVVAAPNQGQALAALGVHQNLFQQGRAQVAEDPAAIKAALAAPGVPLRRPKDGKALFAPVSDSGSDAWAKAAKAAGLKAPSKAGMEPKPDRVAIAKARADLKAFEVLARKETAALDLEASELGRRRDQLGRDQEAQRKRLWSALSGSGGTIRDG